MNPPEFTVVGSGLAGTLLACFLAKAGHRVALHEKRSDPRVHGGGRGRSINLALSVRGLHALRQVGVAEAVLANAILMRGRMIHSPTGKLTYQPYGKDDSEALHSVSRAGLNHDLVVAAAQYPDLELHFDHRCVGLDLETGDLEFVHERTRESFRVASRVVVGADGAFSAIRARLQKLDRYDYSQSYLTHGYKELTIPAGAGGTFQMERNALHIWPRGHFMMIALPNADGSFTCTLFWPFEGPNSFAALRTADDVQQFFRRQFPDALPLLPNLADEFLHNPTGSLVTIRCHPWHVGGRVVLIGDACHAVVPFLGQGMNAAFEDCVVLDECLRQYGADRARAFAEYEARRKLHVDTLADLCLVNFVEMRDRVGSQWFVLRKRLEIALHALLGQGYLPLYTMIEFTRIPYADALRRARWQDRIVTLLGLGFLLAVLLVAYWLVASR